MSRRYNQTGRILAGERLLWCMDCGAVVADAGVTAHDRFHGPAPRAAPDLAGQFDDPSLTGAEERTEAGWTP